MSSDQRGVNPETGAASRPARGRNPIRIIAEYDVGTRPTTVDKPQAKEDDAKSKIPLEPPPFTGTMYTIAHGYTGQAKYLTKTTARKTVLDYIGTSAEDSIGASPVDATSGLSGDLSLADIEELEYQRSKGDPSREELLCPEPIYYVIRCACCPARGRWCCRQVIEGLERVPSIVFRHIFHNPRGDIKALVADAVFAWIMGLLLIFAVEGTYGRLESQYLKFEGRWLSIFITPFVLGVELHYIACVTANRLYHAAAAVFSNHNMVLGGIGTSTTELHWLLALLGLWFMYYWIALLYIVIDAIPKTFRKDPNWKTSDSVGVFANYCVVNIIYPMTLLIILACTYGLLYLIRRTIFNMLPGFTCTRDGCWYSRPRIRKQRRLPQRTNTTKSTPASQEEPTRPTSAGNTATAQQEYEDIVEDGDGCSCACFPCRYIMRKYFPYNPILGDPPNPEELQQQQEQRRRNEVSTPRSRLSVSNTSFRSPAMLYSQSSSRSAADQEIARLDREIDRLYNRLLRE